MSLTKRLFNQYLYTLHNPCLCSILNLQNGSRWTQRTAKYIHNGFITQKSKKGLPETWGSKSHKGKRDVKLQMASIALSAQDEDILFPFRVQVKEQGVKVKNLKEGGANEVTVKAGVQELKRRKKILEEEIGKLSPHLNFDKARMNDLVKRRFYYENSFDIYGGIVGQYDFGPVGCDIMENIISAWQRHFVIQDRMLKVNCSILTPATVLKASGHTDRFSDIMAKDMKTGECFRLDHIVKMSLEQNLTSKKYYTEEKESIKNLLCRIDSLSQEELGLIIKDHNIKSPRTGNALSDPLHFNLMFPVDIGPQGLTKGFLRPETSQGIFINFKKLLKFNQDKLPFACAQIGNAYRNEISPSAGPLRVREFTMAEIAHFSYPDDKTHSKFKNVTEESVLLYSACNQMDGHSPSYISIGEAVDQSILPNEILGYYLARIQSFLIKIGIDKKRLRFRQHMTTELAHYACDCWDAECLTSHGWVECVGCADRSAYDLLQHSFASKEKLVVERNLKESVALEKPQIYLNKSLIRKTYPEDLTNIESIINDFDALQIADFEEKLQKCGEFILDNDLKITKRMISEIRKVVSTEKITPNVIEPSFGIGRIFYSVLEHTFRVREDDARTYFSLPNIIAPIKVSVFPLGGNEEFLPVANNLVDELINLDIKVRLEDSAGSIGKRYTKADEIAVPYGITVDFDTLTQSPPIVTIRERDSMEQVQVLLDEVTNTVKGLLDGHVCWSKLLKSKKFEGQQIKRLQ